MSCRLVVLRRDIAAHGVVRNFNIHARGKALILFQQPLFPCTNYSRIHFLINSFIFPTKNNGAFIQMVTKSSVGFHNYDTAEVKTTRMLSLKDQILLDDKSKTKNYWTYF